MASKQVTCRIGARRDSGRGKAVRVDRIDLLVAPAAGDGLARRAVGGHTLPEKENAGEAEESGERAGGHRADSLDVLERYRQVLTPRLEVRVPELAWTAPLAPTTPRRALSTVMP